MSIICNHDCFNCPYPDVPDECLEAALTPEEIRAAAEVTMRAEAKRAQRRDQYAQNREQILARQKAWRTNNLERVREYRRAYYRANPKPIQEANRRYRLRHREELNRKRAEKRRQNPEQYAQYARNHYHANRDRILARSKRRREANKRKYAEAQSIIRIARKQAGLTQKELGHLCGLSHAMISCWESGEQKANWGVLFRALPQLREMVETEVEADV